jgi:hypothetical protein
VKNTGTQTSIARYVRHPVTYVWALLIAATTVSWVLGAHHDILIDSRRVATVGVLLIAFAKVHFVGMYFMELRQAPRALSWVFNGWVLAVCAVIIGLYLSG